MVINLGYTFVGIYFFHLDKYDAELFGKWREIMEIWCWSTNNSILPYLIY